MVEALVALREARALIADPAKWTAGAFARGANGRAVPPGGKHAVCWCAEGALAKVCRIHADKLYLTDAYKALHKQQMSEPWRVNDIQGHAATIAMFDGAIAAVES